jgi:hypothetical protein
LENLYPVLDTPTIPKDPNNPTLREALQSTEREEWIEAILIEINTLLRKDSFNIVPRNDIPRGSTINPSKFVLRKKNIVFKARITTCGNRDPWRGDTYAPTATKSVLYLILAMVQNLQLIVTTLDITAAFVTEKIHREVYTIILKDIYVKLNKYLYGLTDSPKAFYDGLAAKLKEGQYSQSNYDRCLFYKIYDSNSYIYIIFHVDDFILASTHQEHIDDVVTFLGSKYEVRNSPLKTYLGLNIDWDIHGCMHLSRPVQLERLFKKYPPTATGTTSPMTTEYDKNCHIVESSRCDLHTYQSIVGILITVIDVKPQILYAVSKVSQRTQESNENDMKALYRIINYLYYTRFQTLNINSIRMNRADIKLKLRAYTDASYGTALLSRSQMCYGFELVRYYINTYDNNDNDLYPHPENDKISTGLFYTKTGVTSNVDLSSCQAEINTMVECTKNVTFFQGILIELNHPQTDPTPIYNDNEALETMAKAPSGKTKNIKHMLPKINYLIEQTGNGTILPCHISTKELNVDIGTKAIVGAEFAYKAEKCLGPDYRTPDDSNR